MVTDQYELGIRAQRTAWGFLSSRRSEFDLAIIGNGTTFESANVCNVLGRHMFLVCTNVPYDAGYDKLCRIFPSMREWLVHTVRLLMEKTDLPIVVRAHPGEAAHYGGKERSEDNLAAAGLFPVRV
jgi:hypothetical protein